MMGDAVMRSLQTRASRKVTRDWPACNASACALESFRFRLNQNGGPSLLFFDAFSLCEPGPTSLENAAILLRHSRLYPPHLEKHRKAMRLEGWPHRGLMIRDAQERSSP